MHSAQPNTSFVRLLADENRTAAFGAALGEVLHPGLVIYLEGDLGAGKTTLVRALLRGRGHAGPVKSPTYSLVEVYVISSLYWYHFDFYRFNHPEEFADAGLDEYFRSDSTCLVEWPDRAEGFVPPADLVLRLSFSGTGRCVDLAARSLEGASCLRALNSLTADFPTASADVS